MKRSRWLLLGIAMVLVISPLATLTGNAGPGISFSQPPADAQKNTNITSVAYDADGESIQVSGASGPVTISIDPTSTNLPTGYELTARNPYRTRGGVATITGVKINLHGVYKLRATDATGAFIVSGDFQIWDSVDLCDVNPGDQCHGNHGVLKDDQIIEDISGTSSTGAGVVAISFGVDSITCGQAAHGPTTVTFFAEGLGEKTATITYSAEWDRTQSGPQNGAGRYEVCYESDTPFRADGAAATDPRVNLGYLPDCSVSASDPIGPPCVASRNKNKGNVIIVLRLGEGDPRHN